MQSGLLSDDLAPVRRRVERILDSRAIGAGELSQRTRVLRATAREPGPAFAEVASGLAMRRRLSLRYHGRVRDTVSQRRVSPQRLVYYRDNWYLDAWCHQADGLRSFSLDRIQAAEMLEEAAEELMAETLDVALGAGYGIFPGPARATAVLRFSPTAQRWLADERWHPQQQARWDDQGQHELRIPYAEAKELVRDILAFGPEVEVLHPPTLRGAAAARLAQAADIYR